MPVERLKDEDETDLSWTKNSADHTTQSENVNNEPAPPSGSRSKLALLRRRTVEKKKTIANDDPFRFQGVGVNFKAKLIGIREVTEPRGDSICNEAMQMAKASVKTSGQHKQRIILNISLDGLKIRDEKSGQSLYQFPVARISFIARDTTDARAFGFIFGTSESKHRFYGIKTAQTADRAVLTIRDMFHVVFEMKKKQIEQVKQKKDSTDEKRENGRKTTEVAVADLLDLESELHNLEQGMHQLQSLTISSDDDWPSGDSSNFADPRFVDFQSAEMFTSSGKLSSSGSDPFGDSFTNKMINDNNKAGWTELAVATNGLVNNTCTVADPFDTSQVLKMLQIAPTAVGSASQQPNIDWGSPSILSPVQSIHNSAYILTSIPLQPLTQPTSISLQPTISISKRQDSWAHLDEKLVNLDSLIPSAIGTSGTDPFYHIKNPPRPSMNSLAGQTTMAGRPTSNGTNPFIGSVRGAVDPFNDDFFH